ncbi:hypothetical protein HH308_05905 [Gordonia sp. TBRC 11910]|uniref:Low molecular weight antigen MTB12-like C-terminal domain-containing protein n=1 Tax=Gordonia asplenii TaxID=2725283 RepID=A0A848KZ74_9ACTN|nr:hypothetical protein [Gordonia asplenii]
MPHPLRTPIRSTAAALCALLMSVGLAAVVAAPAPAKTFPPNFTVTAEHPTLADLNDIVEFIVETPASDEAKAANVEGGMSAVVVPRTVYQLGLFRAPRGWNDVTGPLVQRGNSVTATLNSGSAGRPTIRMTIEFKRLGGNWKLAASSMCQGVKAVGLNIYCNS